MYLASFGSLRETIIDLSSYERTGSEIKDQGRVAVVKTRELRESRMGSTEAIGF